MRYRLHCDFFNLLHSREGRVRDSWDLEWSHGFSTWARHLQKKFCLTEEIFLSFKRRFECVSFYACMARVWESRTFTNWPASLESCEWLVRGWGFDASHTVVTETRTCEARRGEVQFKAWAAGPPNENITAYYWRKELLGPNQIWNDVWKKI